MCYGNKWSKSGGDKVIIVNLSGRGDKDVQHVARIKGEVI